MTKMHCYRKNSKKDKSLEDVKEVDDKGKAILDENGNQVVTRLKSIYTQSIKQQANSSPSTLRLACN